MNFSERNNYIIGVFVSLIIHFYLMIIHLPGIFTPKEPEIKTFPIGLVEFHSESKSQQLSVALNIPGKDQPNQKKTEILSAEKLDKQSVSSEKPKTKSPEPAQHSKDDTIFSEKEEPKVSDILLEKPENLKVPSGVTEKNGSGNSDTGESQSFGTGEAMVKIIGPMPTYPPTALREGKEGEVTIRILVNADGQLDLVIVTKSSGDVRLDYAATSSIEQRWKFTSINKGYYIDLTFSFDMYTEASVKFLASKTR